MIIETKQTGKKIQVDVSNEQCELYSCFSPHKYQHRQYNETEGSMTNSDNYYSCSYRNYYGCPETLARKI